MDGRFIVDIHQDETEASMQSVILCARSQLYCTSLQAGEVKMFNIYIHTNGIIIPTSDPARSNVKLQFTCNIDLMCQSYMVFFMTIIPKPCLQGRYQEIHHECKAGRKMSRCICR